MNVSQLDLNIGLLLTRRLFSWRSVHRPTSVHTGAASFELERVRRQKYRQGD